LADINMRIDKWISILIVLYFAVFAGTAHAAKLENLHRPNRRGSVSLEETLAKRRSIRQFEDKALTIDQISQLFWAGQGITKKSRGLRTAPSAGATYPLTLYGVTKDGVYRYLPGENSLQRISSKDQRNKLSIASYGQRWIAKVPLNVLITADLTQMKSRYGDSAERYTDMEAGHVAQNILLQAVALGLGAVPVGAFLKNPTKMMLGLPDNEIPLYIISIGYPKD